MHALYELALMQLPKVGDVTAKALIQYFGNAQRVFDASPKALGNVPRVGQIVASLLYKNKDIALKTAEQELIWAQKQKIQVLHFYESNYPKKLKYCNNAPLVLFYQGSANLNSTHILSIVGTRNATPYGKEICTSFIEEISSIQDVLVVSGLAYGIDIAVHNACIENNIPTLGIVAHGLDRIYPSAHTKIAHKMCENGGILTEFIRNTKPDKENFPKRNRIIAGIADATIVVEAGLPGGALITADIAHSYSRDVFAYPGRSIDKYSQGCNHLIKYQKAQMITRAQDVIEAMNWDLENRSKPIQKSLFVELSEAENNIVNVLKTGDFSIDELCGQLDKNQRQLSLLLLELELKGIIVVLPGKIYRWIG